MKYYSPHVTPFTTSGPPKGLQKMSNTSHFCLKMIQFFLSQYMLSGLTLSDPQETCQRLKRRHIRRKYWVFIEGRIDVDVALIIWRNREQSFTLEFFICTLLSLLSMHCFSHIAFGRQSAVLFNSNVASKAVKLPHEFRNLTATVGDRQGRHFLACFYLYHTFRTTSNP